ncbi:TrkH family potassium uptake protein [Pseudoalteromonas tunicata]|uniref:TrkH family potassium uptake protein n=1 Tax=Pseudoalteromonas tunicata TaxID=314281 RepID=UPI00273E325B|nr:TrkH family potassium uptake protein [Pseudoalteromonas tunicata]MDP4984223.1 TrkH family potassium uptake protein [Pseudoalteromonas tunicata]
MTLWDPRYSPYKSKKITSRHKTRLNPPRVLFLGFLFLIFIGAMLLKLPAATTTPISWLQAVFTATSAVTVTGLVLFDTGSQFTVFGQVTIALLIQVGGLGFMTFAILAALSVGARFDIGKQLIAQEAFGQISFDKLIETAKYVFFFSLVIEFIGFVLLLLCWLPEIGFNSASYQAFFYTISAFNNAGFALNSDSLTPYQGDIGINLIITGLFIIGGIGFIVLIDLKNNCRWHKLSTNSKLVLKSTLIINLIAFFAIWLLEANNPETLANLSVKNQALSAWFQAVSPRTAGFNTVPIESLSQGSTVLILLLMFIGGGSLSTASGLKISTFVVLIFAVYHYLRQREQVHIMGRTIEQTTINKSFSLFAIYVLVLFLSIFILAITEHATLVDVVFEAVSAIGTVGLSRGLTSNLSSSGEWVIIVLMLIGRLGPLTFIYLIASPKKKYSYFATAQIKVG